MSVDELHEKAYSPSAWSKQYSSLELMSKFLQSCYEATVNVRKTIPCQLDIPYGSSERTKYDIYGTNLPDDAPVMIFIHGGYWQEGSKDLAGFHVPLLTENEIKVFNVGYDLCPTVTLTEIVAEIKIVIAEILKISYAAGCKKIWIVGHSAGAHLAASILYNYEWIISMKEQNLFQLIKGIVLISGIYSLQPLLTTSYNLALKLTEQEVETLSFNDLDGKKIHKIHGIKVIVTVGESDAPVFVDESKNIAKSLLDFVDHVEFILMRDDIDHFDIVENFVDPNFLLSKIIMNNIKCG